MAGMPWSFLGFWGVGGTAGGLGRREAQRRLASGTGCALILRLWECARAAGQWRCEHIDQMGSHRYQKTGKRVTRPAREPFWKVAMVNWEEAKEGWARLGRANARTTRTNQDSPYDRYI